VNINNPNESNFYPKKLTANELYYLGIPEDNFKTVNTLDDLKKNPPNIIIAECVNVSHGKNKQKKTFKEVKYSQNKFTQQSLIRKHIYVMGAGIYMQLHYDMRSNTEILKPASIQFKKLYKQYNGEDLSDKTLLVFRQGGIGDLLFIQPNLIYLKQKYPSCTIKFACGPQYQSMVKEWDCVDKVLELPFEASELITGSDYQCVFEGVIERCKEAENICSYNLFTKWMGLNLEDNLLIPNQKPNEESIIKNRKILEELNINEKDYIVIQMRASSPIRTPNPEIWKKLINILTSKGHNILITDSPHYSKDIDNFILKLENKDKVKNFCKFSNTISDTISIVSMSKLTIATDSALNHIAESLSIKSFSIMGPFPGRVRFSTYKNNDYIDVTRENCSPCFIHGSQPCKNSFNGYSACYNNLDYDLCVEKIERLLNV